MAAAIGLAGRYFGRDRHLPITNRWREPLPVRD